MKGLRAYSRIAARCLALVTGAGLAFSGIFGPGPNTTTIPSTGQDLSILLTAPLDGQPYGPSDTITVEGNVAVGSVAGMPINLLYIVDLSGSTFSPITDLTGDGVVDPADNCNFPIDTHNGSPLDAECFGVLALNRSIGNPGNVDVGIVAFAELAASGDMQPQSGVQLFTSPPQADLADTFPGPGVPDVEDVIRSVSLASVTPALGTRLNIFSPTMHLNASTHYNNALLAMLGAFSTEPSGETNIAFMMSDGFPSGAGSFTTGPGSPLDQARMQGIKINTFAVGSGVANGCSPGQPLRLIADETGGTCVEVTDPGALSATLPAVTPAGLDRVEVNGAVVPVDALGNFTINLTCPAPGPFDITATAFADDADGTVVSADVTVDCLPPPPPLAIDIKPGSSVNPVNLKSKGVIPVAILGSATFDVADVDVTTLAFGPAGAPPAHAAGGHEEDVNADGFMDLVSHYRTQRTGIMRSDTEACVTGEAAGAAFMACDSIEIRPKNNNAHKNKARKAGKKGNKRGKKKGRPN